MTRATSATITTEIAITRKNMRWFFPPAPFLVPVDEI